jgi:hypothetical protein
MSMPRYCIMKVSTKYDWVIRMLVNPSVSLELSFAKPSNPFEFHEVLVWVIAINISILLHKQSGVNKFGKLVKMRTK